MAAQQKQPPPPLTIRELAFLGERLQEAISVLQDFGFPETLGHIDFNPGNILITPARCVFLDWAEACVTHPFRLSNISPSTFDAAAFETRADAIE